ncbi:MAG: DEAD/DEAH box helicase, partial [Chloroflexota bacterium]|nr:DEAD/DEAH box helicase [Chloroflexota bacterium]
MAPPEGIADPLPDHADARSASRHSKPIVLPAATPGSSVGAVDHLNLVPTTADPTIEAQIDQFAALYPFALDAFQREAIRILLDGDSVMVAAPTGTGKTLVAEFAIYDAFKRTGRVLYTTPIKALSIQKYRDLRAIYGDAVGLLTGDVSENRDAQVVVM